MKLDKTYRKHAAKLLRHGETIVAAPLLLHPTSGRMRAANNSGLLAADHLAEGFDDRLELDEEDEVIPLGPLAVATNDRLVFFEVSRTAISTKPRPKSINGEYPFWAVSLSWSDLSLSGLSVAGDVLPPPRRPSPAPRMSTGFDDPKGTER